MNDMDRAIFKIGYGLYVVTCNDGNKDNGLIVNSVMQLTSTPKTVAVAINKQNYSHDVILETKQASVSMLQRRLKLGYARAARIVDEMEEKGIVGPFQGSKPREILITQEQWDSMRSGGATQMEFDDLPVEENEIQKEL